MLYIFKVVDAPFIKMGFTGSCPWQRIATGFWSNIHPLQCCSKLGWQDLELVALYAGGLDVEAAVKASIPPVSGEFWAEDMLKPLMTLLGFLGGKGIAPPRPERPPPVDRPVEKLPCCGGRAFNCWRCDMTFQRAHHLRQHLESHGGSKVACSRCSLRVLKRNLKRHESNCRA